MSAGLLASAWARYRDAVVPAGAGDVQLIETRRAFYAGVAAFIEATARGFDPGLEVTDRDLAVMDGVVKELRDYLRVAGRPEELEGLRGAN